MIEVTRSRMLAASDWLSMRYRSVLSARDRLKDTTRVLRTAEESLGGEYPTPDVIAFQQVVVECRKAIQSALTELQNMQDDERVVIPSRFLRNL